MAIKDPRRIITPDAFTVAPELLGVGLARPSRRLIAIAIDGVLIAILSNLGGRTLLALGIGVMFWRGSRKPANGTSRAGADGIPRAAANRTLARSALRFASIIMLIVFSFKAYSFVTKKAVGWKGTPVEVADADDDTNIDPGSGNVDLNSLGLGMSDVFIMPEIATFSKSPDSASAAPHADSLAHWIAAKPDSMHGRMAVAVMDALQGSPGGAALRASLGRYLPPDSLAERDSLHREAGYLRARVASLERQNSSLKKQYESEKQGFSFRKFLKGVSDVLGFGFGWSALYFTAFTLLMRGQTPGKKLLGIRVIRLDGQPITGWMSFERFGGYAASAATGLLGFAQILWDRNRQALHDKATETVVIREHAGVPERPFDAPGAVIPFRASGTV